MKKILLIAIALFVTTLSYSQNSFVNNFITYNVTTTNTNNPTVETTGYNVAGGPSVVIPTTVTNNSTTYAITGIASDSFNNKNLTSVTIPNGVTSIGSHAFTINSLTSIVIPNTVTNIGISAFSFNQITSVIIPNSVTILGTIAFVDNQLASVTISENITNINAGTFQGNQLTSVIIPNNVTIIGANAFLNNQLTDITIPENVVTIGERAFRGNPLNSVTSLKTTPPVTTKDQVNDSFAFNRSTIDLYIPVGSTANYNVFAWTGFASTTEGTLSISNFEIENNIKLLSFDNKIEVKTSDTIQLQNYKIYNISGIEVSKGTESEIYINSLSTGIYILKINFDKGTYTKKIVIN